MSKFKILTFTHLGAVLASVFLGFMAGSAHVQNKWDKEKAASLSEQHSLLVRGIDDTFRLGLHYAEQQQEIRYVTKEVIREVPKYMPDTRVCPVLPDGFSSLYNKSASGPGGRTATSGDDGAS